MILVQTASVPIIKSAPFNFNPDMIIPGHRDDAAACQIEMK